MKTYITTFAIALMLLTSTPAMSQTESQEIDTIKFICNSPITVESVVIAASDPNVDLIMGISPLPNGCQWTIGNREGEIHETIRVIDVPGEEHRYARISRVTLNGVEGYSAGLIELLS